MSEIKLNFSTFILSLASTVHMSAGFVPNPATGKTDKNLPAAKETISLLEILKEKTKGNLTKEEEELFDNMLFECRMVYMKGAEEK
jgi:hypothetical protein